MAPQAPTPAPLVPVPHPGPLPGPGGAPAAVPPPIDTLGIAKSEYERLPDIRRNAERMLRLERIMQLAEATRGKPIDPMLKHWLMSIVEEQKDGKELFLPKNGPGGTGPEVISAAIRTAKENTEKSLIDAQKNSGTDVTNLFSALDAAKEVLSNAKSPAVKTVPLLAAIEDALKKKDSMQKLRLDIDEVLFLMAGALAEGKTLGDLMDMITKKTLHPDVSGVFIAKIRAATTPPVLDRTFVNDVLTDLEKLFLSNLGVLKTDVTTILNQTRDLNTVNEMNRKVMFADLNKETRAFNSMFGGTNAETILGHATVDGRVNLSILEAQLAALGWEETSTATPAPTPQEHRISLLRANLSSVSPLPNPTEISPEITEDQKKELLIFIQSKITTNASGVSLNLMNQRVNQFQILREWAYETLKALRDPVSGEITVNAVNAAITAPSPSFGLPDAKKIFDAAGVDMTNGTADLNKDQLEALSLAIARAKDETLLTDKIVKDKTEAAKVKALSLNLTNLNTEFGSDIKPLEEKDLTDIGITVEAGTTILTIDADHELAFASLIRSKQIEEITGGKKEANVPLSQSIKDYASEGSRLFGRGFEVWLAWNKSLLNNVRYTKHDAALQDTIAIEDEILAIEEALSGIGKLDDKGVLQDGKLLSAVGKTIKKSSSSMEEAHRLLVTAGSITKPTRDIDISVKNAQELAEVGEFIIKELNLHTCFKKINDPVIRRRAFYIAMYFGIDDAKAYMDPGQNYETLNPTRMDAIRPAEIRFLDSGVANNLHLAPLERYGLTLDPRATIIMRDTCIPGTCDSITLDCPPTGKALALILRDTTPDKSLVNKLIRVYTLKRAEDGLSLEEANRIVDGIREKLALDDDYLQLAEDNKTDHRFDPLNTINSAYDAVKGMIQGDTFAEKALGWALVGGTVYGIMKAWPKHWKKIMTIPMLLGANIALKRMTGKSAADYLNMHYMDAKYRNSPLEQFIRRNRFVEGFSEVESPAGRAAVSVLTDPTNPIPVEELLHWRHKMNESGATKYAEYAPPALKNKLSPIINEMGTMNTGGPRDLVREEALRIAFVTFRAQCVDIDRARGLGGISTREQEEAGADYIRRMYTSLNPDCETHCPDPPPIVGMCGVPPCATYTMREIFVLERPSEALMKPLETWTETVFSKAGVVVAYGGDKLRDGYTAIEKRTMQLGEDYPIYIDWTKENIMENYATFNNWRRRSALKSGQTFSECTPATFDLLKNSFSAAGLLIKATGPEAVEIVYDVGVGGMRITKDTALSLYRGLKKMHITGPVLLGLEKFIEKELHPVAELEFADLTDVAVFKKNIVTLLSEKLNVGPDFATKKLDTLMAALNIETETNLAARAIKMELFKRSLYSFLIASRMHEIALQQGFPVITQPQSGFAVDFPERIDVSNYTLEISTPRIKEFYDHIFTHYDPKHASVLIGQDRALGIALDQKSTESGFLGTGAAIINWFGDNVLMDTAGDYLKASLATYLEPVMHEAQKTLSPTEAQKFRAYMNTLLMNVIVEMTLANGDTAAAPPLHLTVERAKDYLAELQITRGSSMPARIVGEDFANIEAALDLYSVAPITTSTRLENVRRDASLGTFFGGGIALAGPPAALASSSGASGGGSTTPPGSTGPALGPAGSPPAAPPAAPSPAPAHFDALLKQTIEPLSPTDQTMLLAQLESGTREDEIRTRFDNFFENHLQTGAGASFTRDALINTYIGASDGYWTSFVTSTYKGAAEELFLKTFTSPPDLTEVANRVRITTDPGAKTRLLQLAKRSLGARMSEAFTTAKTNRSAAIPLAEECLKAAQNLDPLSKDMASLLMEFIFCGGDYSTQTFDAYKLFAPPGIDYRNAPARFAAGNKVKVEVIENSLNALK